MTTDNLNYTVSDGIATITIDRNDKKNAISSQMRDEFNNYLHTFEQDSDAKALVITGVGDSFCAGMDLEDWEPRINNGLSPDAKIDNIDEIDGQSDQDPEQILQLEHFQLPLDIYNVQKPVIAKINGYALGLGLVIAIACDIRIASTNAIFGLPEIDYGGFPGDQSIPLLVDRIDVGTVMQLTLTGEPFSASRAKDAHVVQEVHSEDELDDRVDEIAEAITSHHLSSTILSKKAIKASEDHSTDLQLEHVNTLMKMLTLISSQSDSSIFGK